MLKSYRWGGGGGPLDFSVSPRPLFGFLGFGAKGLGPGLDNNVNKSSYFRVKLKRIEFGL